MKAQKRKPLKCDHKDDFWLNQNNKSKEDWLKERKAKAQYYIDNNFTITEMLEDITRAPDEGQDLIEKNAAVVFGTLIYFLGDKLDDV